MAQLTISPDEPFRVAGSRYMREQNARIRQHLPGTLAGEDPEELHDMRVASRRLRAAMLVFQGCFRPAEFKLWYARVSALTDALGAPRDADVQLAAIERRREGLPDYQQADIALWVSDLRRRRDTLRVSMAMALSRWEKRGYSDTLDALLDAMAVTPPLAGLWCRLEGRLCG